MIEVEKITSKSRFIKLKPDWENLIKDSDSAFPFLSHDWFYSCLEAFQDNKLLYTIALWDRNKLVGLAPLWIYQDRFRYFDIRNIGFITGPDAPFVDFILTNGDRERILKTLLNYLYVKEKRFWDIFSVGPISDEFPNYSLLTKLVAQRKIKFIRDYESQIPYIATESDWEVFFRSQSQRFRKTYRNVINRMKKLGNVEVENIVKDPEDTLLDAVFHVSKRSWKEKEGFSITSKKEFQKFFRIITEKAKKRDWLFAWLLKVDGIPIAMEFDLQHANQVYALRSDYDEDFKKYSPGSFLEYHIIKYLFENRYSKYYTGPGIRAYKLRWTDQIKNYANIKLCNNNAKGRAIYQIESNFIPLIKKVRIFENNN